MTRKQLRRAARLLHDWAWNMQDSEGAIKHKWKAPAEPDRYDLTQKQLDKLRAEYDEHMALSRALYTLARNPNFQPAR